MRMFVKMLVSQVCFLGTLLCTRENHRVFPRGDFSILRKEDAEQDKFTSAKEEKMCELLALCAESLHWQPLCFSYKKLQCS